jgi:hypothetical protein
MFRARMAVVGLMVGLGLTSGCTSITDRPWFSRLRGVPTEDCCALDDPCMMDGPMLEGPATMLGQPGGPFPGLGQPGSPFPGMPTPVMPPVGATPGSSAPARLVPEPQAQPVPATPSRRTPGTFTEFWR